MASDIYVLHAKAFNRVSAYVIMRGEERVATIAFKFPRDGAGRLYAYVHVFGAPMVRGYAGGYGYDKRSAACSSAAKHIQPPTGEGWEKDRLLTEKIIGALELDDGMN